MAKTVRKSVRIPVEVITRIESLNVNFSEFVRGAIEEKLNTASKQTPASEQTPQQPPAALPHGAPCKYNEGSTLATHKQYHLVICTNPMFSRDSITPPEALCCDKCPGFTRVEGEE